MRMVVRKVEGGSKMGDLGAVFGFMKGVWESGRWEMGLEIFHGIEWHRGWLCCY